MEFRNLWPYRKNKRKIQLSIENMAAEVFSLDILEPADQPIIAEAGSLSVNGLEDFVARFFACDCALRQIQDHNDYSIAREYLSKILILEVSEQYSEAEMKNFVVPVINKRHSEYYGLIDGIGEPGQRMLRVSSAILGNIYSDSFDLQDQLSAAMAISRNLLLNAGRILKLRLFEG